MSMNKIDQWLYSGGKWYQQSTVPSEPEWVEADPPLELVEENALVAVVAEQRKRIEELEECLREVRREFRRFLDRKRQSRPDSERYGL
jgi:hypothetical protein